MRHAPPSVSPTCPHHSPLVHVRLLARVRRSTSALHVPPVPLRDDGTDHLPEQGIADGSVGGSTFHGVQTRLDGGVITPPSTAPAQPAQPTASRGGGSGSGDSASSTAAAVGKRTINALMLTGEGGLGGTGGGASAAANGGVAAMEGTGELACGARAPSPLARGSDETPDTTPDGALAGTGTGATKTASAASTHRDVPVGGGGGESGGGDGGGGGGDGRGDGKGEKGGGDKTVSKAAGP